MKTSATAESTPGQNGEKGRSSPATRSKHRNSQRNLRKLRLLVGATQLQVAEKAGVTERCLRKVEQGKVKAQRGTLAAIEGAIAILGRTAQAAALLLVVLCSSGCSEKRVSAAVLVAMSCSWALSIATYGRFRRIVRMWHQEPGSTSNAGPTEREYEQKWLKHSIDADCCERLWRDEWTRRIAAPEYQTSRLAVWWHALSCKGPVRSYRMRWTGFAASQRRPRPLYAECQHCSWPAQPCDTAKQDPLPPTAAASAVDPAAPIADSARNSYGLRWDGLQRSKGDA